MTQHKVKDVIIVMNPQPNSAYRAFYNYKALINLISSSNAQLFSVKNLW